MWHPVTFPSMAMLPVSRPVPECLNVPLACSDDVPPAPRSSLLPGPVILVLPTRPHRRTKQSWPHDLSPCRGAIHTCLGMAEDKPPIISECQSFTPRMWATSVKLLHVLLVTRVMLSINWWFNLPSHPQLWLFACIGNMWLYPSGFVTHGLGAIRSGLAALVINHLSIIWESRHNKIQPYGIIINI